MPRGKPSRVGAGPELKGKDETEGNRHAGFRAAGFHPPSQGTPVMAGGEGGADVLRSLGEGGQIASADFAVTRGAAGMSCFASWTLRSSKAAKEEPSGLHIPSVFPFAVRFLRRFAQTLVPWCAGAFLIFCVVSFPAHALTEPFDHSLWDQFLKEFVNEEGQVDYAGVKENPELLDRYLEHLAGITDPNIQLSWPREEILALWLNAYHAAMISVIRDHYPIGSVNDIPGIWDIEVIGVGKLRYSLNEIRAVELLGAFRDEKINLALSGGARGCPRLRREAFTGDRVEGQLYLAAREFVNDPRRVEIIPAQKEVRLSRIFRWYASDFQLDFGVFENDFGLSSNEYAVLSFIAYYLNDADQIRFLEEGKYKIKYRLFDWSLNEWRRPQNEKSALPASK